MASLQNFCSESLCKAGIICYNLTLLWTAVPCPYVRFKYSLVILFIKVDIFSENDALK